TNSSRASRTTSPTEDRDELPLCGDRGNLMVLDRLVGAGSNGAPETGRGRDGRDRISRDVRLQGLRGNRGGGRGGVRLGPGASVFPEDPWSPGSKGLLAQS